MTALLDKLKVCDKPDSVVTVKQGDGCDRYSEPRRRWGRRKKSAVEDAAGTSQSNHSSKSTDLASRSAEGQRSVEDQCHEPQPWMKETQMGNAPTSRPISFTYPPGSMPLPPYTVRRGIGVGGFGEVYFAVSEAGKEVALKRIQRNLEVELRGVSHCLNLKHPNLVSLFDICRDEQGQSWVVMEYVAGPNLRQVLDDSPEGLPESEVRRWLAGIIGGVQHLHSAGLVHRDLKPGNIFDDLGVVKVGDYGLSKFISATHRGGHTESVGTFHYMAPEIGRGQYGREIDVYAVGVILYELLTGRVPFDGESCHEIIVKHLTASPDLSGIDEPYRRVISRCLEKDPAKRFGSVVELAAALELSGQGFAGQGLSGQGFAGSNPRLHGLGPTSDVSACDGAGEDDILTAEVVNEADRREQAQVQRSGDGSQSLANQGAGGVALVAGNSPAQAEPLARAVQASFADLGRWWSTLDQSPGSKAALMLLAGFVLLVNTHWLLPLLSFIGVVYVPYYIVRQMLLHVRQQPTYAEAQRVATRVGPPRRPLTRRQWRTQMRHHLRAKPSVTRLAELNTSWIAAVLTTFGLVFAAAVIGLRHGPVDVFSIAPYGWMAMVVLVASLGLLSLGKLWEREEGESLPRRLVLAGVGAGVGLMAFSLSRFLILPLDQGLGRDIDATSLPQTLYRDGVPVASAMMAHFAVLFALLRWWKPVDPLRRTRLSLWAVAVACVGEWAVHQIIPIPQPTGMFVAGGIAIAVQLSAPWINPRRDEEQPRTNRSGAPAANVRSMA